jgi:hypothetical protein
MAKINGNLVYAHMETLTVTTSIQVPDSHNHDGFAHFSIVRRMCASKTHMLVVSSYPIWLSQYQPWVEPQWARVPKQRIQSTYNQSKGRLLSSLGIGPPRPGLPVNSL